MPITSNRDINYLSKDFDSIKADLVDYVKRHFPSDWRDFNDASGGMALLEMIAYVGDILTFNIDRQVNEAYINRAVEIKNIVSLAQNFGYKPKNQTPPSTCHISICPDSQLGNLPCISRFRGQKVSRRRIRVAMSGIS